MSAVLNPHPSLHSSRARARLRRVLIVDDNREAADILASMLTFLGYETQAVYDGESGLEAAAWFEPDVAVWDISLPGIDGYEAARRLREASDGQRVLLIALTALGKPADVRNALAAGFDRHMSKPVDVNELLTELGCA